MWSRRARRQSELTRESSESTSLAWRERALLRAGTEPPLARSLAADPDADLHAFIGLLERGCPAGLALRILAPLEGEDRSSGR